MALTAKTKHAIWGGKEVLWRYRIGLFWIATTVQQELKIKDSFLFRFRFLHMRYSLTPFRVLPYQASGTANSSGSPPSQYNDKTMKDQDRTLRRCILQEFLAMIIPWLDSINDLDRACLNTLDLKRTWSISSFVPPIYACVLRASERPTGPLQNLPFPSVVPPCPCTRRTRVESVLTSR